MDEIAPAGSREPQATQAKVLELAAVRALL